MGQMKTRRSEELTPRECMPARSVPFDEAELPVVDLAAIIAYLEAMREHGELLALRSCSSAPRPRCRRWIGMCS